MAGIVYLRTNKFEVKLEGITFKARDFDSLCKFDFLFPKDRVWVRPPVVGVDVMRHPRDPSILLLLLCFGVGCVILRFKSGECLPKAILNFLTDERLRFVGFGIPEKMDLFPFEEVGLSKNKIDVGYLAAKILNDSKFKTCELADLSKKVLGIKKMVGLTDASSFERHEPIKAGICQLFVASVIAMALLQIDCKKKSVDSPRKQSFFKSMNLLPMLNEGWFKVSSKDKKHSSNNNSKFSNFVESCYNLHHVRAKHKDDTSSEESFSPIYDYKTGGMLGNLFRSKSNKESGFNDLFRSRSNKESGFNELFRSKSTKVGDGFDDVWARVRGIDPVVDDDVWSTKHGDNDKNFHSLHQSKHKVQVSQDDFVCPKCKECGSGDLKSRLDDDYTHSTAKDKRSSYNFDLKRSKGFDDEDDYNEYIHFDTYKDYSSSDEFAKTETSPSQKVPLKGILKCPSNSLEDNFSPPSGSEDKRSPNLKRANSKGFNVKFKEY